MKKSYFSVFSSYSLITVFISVFSLIYSNQLSAQTITIDSVKNVTCKGFLNGAAYITASGGAGGYSYSWSNGDTNEDATGLAAGVYTITVTDAALSTATETVSITEPAVLSSTLTSTDVTCKGLSTGSATVTVSGGTTPYSYNWFPSGGTGLSATGLSAGNYVVGIVDSNSCVTSHSVTITEPAILSQTLTSTDVTCNGLSTGSTTVTVSGGTTPYTYSWSSGGTDISATGLAAGDYTIDITDSNACALSATVTITEPGILSHTMSSTDVTCNGLSTGSATVTVSGGTTPYTYSWSSGGTDLSITGLVAGDYTIDITDSNACALSATVTITEPGILSHTMSSTDVTCNGFSTGSATVSVSGGTTPYTYSWSSGGTNMSATGLAAGDYTIDITDSNACALSATVTITEPGILSHTMSSTDVTCNGFSTGSATVTVSGGTTPYTYAWNPSGGTNMSATGLSAATYTINITDSNACALSATVTITEPGILSHTMSSTNVTCNGLSTGSATVTVSGGTTPYTYLWSPSGGTNMSATGLSAATYTINITDNNSCALSATVTITQPAILNTTVTPINVTCNGFDNGSASISVAGGTSPYTYSWQPIGGTNATATGLSPNTYTVSVTDKNGCTNVKSTTITQPSILSSTVAVVQSVSCKNGSDGIAMVTASGGTSPYTYSWKPSGGTNATASNLAANTYTATVTDNKGCTIAAPVTITEPTAISLTVTPTQTVTCNGGNNGIATVAVSGGTPSYTYSWSSSGGTNATASNLTAGTFTVTVTDSKSCIATKTVTIQQPSALTITTLTATPSNCGQADGTANVAVTGGTSPYTYSWYPSGETTASVTGLVAGNYSVAITDNNTCVTSGTVNVPNSTGFAVSISSSTMVTCNGDCDGAITTSISGGTGPYTYVWSNGATTTDISNLCSAVYSVTVTDSTNCTDFTSLSITEPAPVVITPLGASTICSGQTVQLSASVTGGNSSYNYTWSAGGETTDTLNVSPTSTASYTIGVTDSNGCTSTDEVITITVNPPLTLNIIGSSSICMGDTISLTALASGGNGNYSYLWDTLGETTSVIMISPTAQTIYSVTVTDDCGSLEASASFTVNVNALPVVMFTASDLSGCAPLDISFTNLSNPTGASWYWLFGDGTSSSLSDPAHEYTSSGDFDVSLTVLDSNGCYNSLTQNSLIQVYDNPVASFTMNPTGQAGLGSIISFGSTSTGGSIWYWSFGDDANSTDTQSSTQFTYTQEGTYTIIHAITNTDGCSDTATSTITIQDDEFAIFIPSAFTPNGDGRNDSFGPEGSGVDVDNYQFIIYNRWGDIVFYTEVWGRKWDGRVNWPLPLGETADYPAQQDVFLWKYLVKDMAGNEHSETGTVTILGRTK